MRDHMKKDLNLKPYHQKVTKRAVNYWHVSTPWRMLCAAGHFPNTTSCRKVLLTNESAIYCSGICIATGYGLDGRGSIPSRGKIFPFSTMSRPAPRSTQPPIHWVLGLFPPGVKQPERETDYSSPSSSEIKNGWAALPLHSMSSWHSA
jgi:hypothetical protein